MCQNKLRTPQVMLLGLSTVTSCLSINMIQCIFVPALHLAPLLAACMHIHQVDDHRNLCNQSIHDGGVLPFLLFTMLPGAGVNCAEQCMQQQPPT